MRQPTKLQAAEYNSQTGQLVCLGKVHTRANIIRLLLANDGLNPGGDYEIVGEPLQGWAPFTHLIQEAETAVHWLGDLPQNVTDSLGRHEGYVGLVLPGLRSDHPPRRLDRDPHAAVIVSMMAPADPGIRSSRTGPCTKWAASSSSMIPGNSTREEPDPNQQPTRES